MLGKEDQVTMPSVIEAVMATSINKHSKIKLLKRLQELEGHNDDYSFIDKEIEKVILTITNNSC